LKRSGIPQKLKDEIVELRQKKKRVPAILEELKNKYPPNDPRSKKLNERNIYYVLEEYREKFELSPEDTPWSFGACLADPFMAKQSALLLEIQTMLLKRGRFLTVRRAKWISHLAEPMTPKLDIYKTAELRNMRLYQIASYYVRQEQVAEIHGIPLNTSKLDLKFIFPNGLVNDEEILRSFGQAFVMDEQEDSKKIKNFNPISMEQQILDKLPAGKGKEFKHLIDELLLINSEAELEKFLANRFNIVSEEMKNLVLEWAAFSRRRDIENYIVGI